ncbi:MAG: hypothetical protein AUG12_00500 [Acidobacteria bacterium 13_1_20CM_2_57_8]|nr:MAG: hypothetical protein AUG12_00500 [Acidobacteria bacterium 13_1_20CM_2_57_8]
MRKWLTAFALIAAMLGGAVGAGAHEGEGSMANMPDCCKRAQSSSSAPVVSMARLCCNLNCSEPGSSSTSASSSISFQQGTTPNTAIIPSVTPNGVTLLSRRAQSTNPDNSSPKYLQHLALLI